MVLASMPLEGGSAIDLARFQEPMRLLATSALSIEIRDYEVAEPERVAAELQPRVLSLLGQCRELLSTVVQAAERLASDACSPSADASAVRESFLPFEHALDAKVARQVGSEREVEEMAFIAHLEIREREDRLRHARSSRGSVAVLSECDSSLRRICKALGAVDTAIAVAAGVTRQIDFTSELSSSLAVRRAYAKLRARVQKQGDPRPEDLRAHLRALGTEIAIFVGSDVYRDLRVQDRLLLRELQQRLLTWLRGGERAESKSGVQLWQDLIACVEMFALVNRRQELVEHDARVIQELLDAHRPAATDVTGQVGQATLAELRKLEGLDPDLDALLRAEAPIPTSLYGLLLARLTERLGIGESWPRPGGVA